jgi:hypothetical protein
MIMKNSKKLEKSRGILAFALNTETTDYISIAEKTLALAAKKLNLPYTLITDTVDSNFTNTRFDIDLNQFVNWRNFNRCSAYELSPYNETLVIDVDYVVVEDSLLNIFECNWDYLLQRKSHALTTEWPTAMGDNSLPYVWATVFAFRKTPRAKLFFNLVDRIQKNYSYYRALFNIRERNYRNDYAFSIADTILNGYAIQTNTIPGSLLAVNQSIDKIELQDSRFVIRDQSKAYIVPRTNLHVMSKKYLQSTNFEHLINQLINE